MLITIPTHEGMVHFIRNQVLYKTAFRDLSRVLLLLKFWRSFELFVGIFNVNVFAANPFVKGTHAKASVEKTIFGHCL